MNRPRIVLLALLTVSVAFAGCTDGDDAGNPADGGSDGGLQEGKGAIRGLLLDDRYRPIHLLADGGDGEFQATGFILVQQTAQQVQSNENGEFQVLNLPPGQYTLRVQSDGHEARTTQVDVRSGVFAEVTIEARRVVSEGSTILTEENSVYIACALDYVANGGNYFCDGDLSLDGYSSSFYTDYSDYGEDVTYMVTEMLANQEKGWEIQLRGSQDDGETTTYFAAELNQGDYVRIQLERGVNADDHQDNIGYTDFYGPWENVDGFSTIVFVDHPYREDHQSIVPEDPVVGLTPFCCGVGFTMGVKATFLQSVFLGPPETDIDSYCILCE